MTLLYWRALVEVPPEEWAGLGSVPGADISSPQSEFLKDKSSPSQWLQGRGKRAGHKAWGGCMGPEAGGEGLGRGGLEDIRDSSATNSSERSHGPGSGYQLPDLGGDPKGESAKI